jgi:MFS family permease
MVFMVGFMMPAANPSVSSLRWLFYVAAATSMLIGPIIEKVRKTRFLLFWVVLGIVLSLFPMILLMSNEYKVATLLILWGFAFGIGFPSCLALIPAMTSVEERGRAGGTIFFVTYAILPLLMIVIGQSNVFSGALMLAIWRSFGLGTFLLDFNIDEDIAQLKPTSYFFLLRQRTFFLYFFPWLAFCLINYFEVQVFEPFFGESTMALIRTIEFVIGFIVCFISGWFMDLKGRRWVIIIGLASLGLGYALLSLFPLISVTLAIYMITDGIAFGIFSVAFVFVVWGDIASGYRGEKYYAIGCLPVLLAPALSMFASPWLRTLDASSAFSLASFFLFMAVIPIFFAPELLPERVLRERELREYVERVKEITSRA